MSAVLFERLNQIHQYYTMVLRLGLGLGIGLSHLFNNLRALFPLQLAMASSTLATAVRYRAAALDAAPSVHRLALLPDRRRTRLRRVR